MKDEFAPLFTSDEDWHNNACLNFKSDATYGYVSGYKYAADSLVHQVHETARNQDILVYPIVFLYRHYLELSLKIIIRDGRILLDDKFDYPKHHFLKDLWPIAKGIVRKIWPGPDPDVMQYLDHIVSEFSYHDPSSMAFRYPTDKNGNKSIPNLKHINLRHLAQCIDKVAEFLEGVHMGIDAYLEHKYEGC